MPPSVELTLSVVFVSSPRDVDLTSIPTAHDDEAAIVPLDNWSIEDVSMSSVAVPPQVFVTFGGLAPTRPEGKASRTATPVCPTVAGLAIVNVILVVPSNGIVGVGNDFMM
jgi:hypothetical protein